MDKFEWFSLWVFLAIWWIVDLAFYFLMGKPHFYKKLKTRLVPKPPSWVFGIVWNILYPMIAVSTWLYLNWNQSDTIIFDAVLSLSLINYTTNKLWYPLFFIWNTLYLAFADAIILLISSVTIVILMWTDTSNNGTTSYVAASLYIPYTIWIIFATALTLDISVNNVPKKKQREKKKKEKFNDFTVIQDSSMSQPLYTFSKNNTENFNNSNFQ